ncbi:MAG TPA: DUF6259 domain-containing protein [Ignavibacteriaceae bacterium]|nr:DUF6259 domain-containing protein [Ignavibacteriaceae bacterium]
MSSSKKLCTGMQNFIIRTPDALSDPVFLTRFNDLQFDGNSLSYVLLDNSGEYNVKFIITTDDAGFRFRMNVTSPLPIWLVEWKLSGFNFKEVIIPALGGQSLNDNMPDGNVLSYKYPFWWNAQFVIGMNGSDGLMIHSRDDSPDLKLLRAGRENNSFSLTYGFEAPAPLKSNSLEAEFYMTGFEGGWQKGVELYRPWMEMSFNPVPFISHHGFPSWADDINFVLELWGARKSFTPGHTFAQMIERLVEWSGLYSPANTLVYLAGFAENGIDSHAPDYNPSEQCGGTEEFKKLIDTAHRMGYHIMLHTNVLAMTFSHRLYNEFRKFQVIDPFGREQTWGLDADGDWLAEPYFAYMNPGYKEWGDEMEKVLGELIERHNADAVFLDQTLLAFNVSKGPNFLIGMRNHIARMQNKFPEILFAGEGLHEQNVSALPFAQIHGIDSLTEVHGMEGQVPWRKVHPVYSYLFGKYTKFIGHLLTRHPSNPMFDFQEAAYSDLGVVPVLSLYNSNQEINIPAVHKMIDRAKSINKKIEI